MLVSGSGGAVGLQAEERSIGRLGMRVGTTTDSWERRYPVAALPAQVQRSSPRRSDLAAPGDRDRLRDPRDGIAGGGSRRRTRIRAACPRIDSRAGWCPHRSGRHPRYAPGKRPTWCTRLSLWSRRDSGSGGKADCSVSAWRPIGQVSSASATRSTSRSPTAPVLSLSDIAIGVRSIPLYWWASNGDTVSSQSGGRIFTKPSR